MKNVVAYCRVSTDGQAGEDKFGIDMQKELIRDYCDKNKCNIVRWFVDIGVSGAEIRRPQLDILLSGDVTNPPVEAVVMAKTDRLARDINLYYTFKQLLHKLNIEIISVTEDWSTQDKLTALILENFLAMSATIEREHIRTRTMGGRRQKAKRGGYSGGRAPMGYKIENGQLTIDVNEAEIVRFIFKERAAGNTLWGIIEALKENGYKTRNGKNFALSTIQSIVNNEKTYQGYYKYGKDSEWVKGQHEPILSESDK